MKRTTILCSAVLGASLLAIPAERGNATEEAAQAKTTPWSGYWWPHRQGLLLRPLAKYDKLTGHKAADWERKTHPPGPNVPSWHGYCHAWSASSVLEPEPRRVGKVQSVPLGVGDQKGMLTACHTQDVANSHGDRFGDGVGSDDPNDLAPDVVWRLLKYYVQQLGVAVVMDVEAGEEVWNYPVYQYRVQYAPASGDGQTYRAQLELYMADDGVVPDFLGTKVRRQTYQFTFKLHNGAIVPGSARWTGPSVKDHPDFAWYPLVAVPENPEIKYPKVKKIVAQVSPQGQPPRPPVTPGQPPGPEQPVPQPVQPTPRPEQPVAPPATGDVASQQQAASVQGAPIPVVSPLELVAMIACRTSAFPLDVTVDRFDGGEYKVGETFIVRGTPAKDGYLYLLYVDSKGGLQLLYPAAGEDNQVKANKEFLKGGSKAFQLTKPYGVDRVKALVTTRPIALTGLTAAGPGQQQTFRWHPTQQQQVQQLLRQYQQQQKLNEQQLGDWRPEALLGPFAQDEVAFYVGPAEDAGAGQQTSPQQQSSPKQQTQPTQQSEQQPPKPDQRGPRKRKQRPRQANPGQQRQSGTL